MSKDLLDIVRNRVKGDEHISIVDSDQMFHAASISYGVPTGLPMLDLHITRPGWPAGRIIELFGFEGCGKTTLGLHAISFAQKMGGTGIFIDSENTFDAHRAQACGVNTEHGNNFLLTPVRSIDAGFRMIKKICESVRERNEYEPVVIVYDSVTGSQNEFDMEKYQIGKEQRTGHEAKVIRQGIKQVSTDISETQVIMIFINHSIAKIASMGEKSQAAGGHAIKFWATNRIELIRLGSLKVGSKPNETIIGDKIKIRPRKNKVGGLNIPDFDVELLQDSGFNTIDNMLDTMLKVGMATRINNRTYSFNGVEFARKEFKNLVEQEGGINKLYGDFYNYCLENGHMRPYDTHE